MKTKKISVIVLSLIISTIYFMSAATHATSVTSDTWTAKGTNNNWSNTANWSNGVPQNGDNLVFNVNANTPLTTTPPASQSSTSSAGPGALYLTSNNNIAGLQLGNISFVIGKNGRDNGTIVTITGDPFSLSGGLSATSGQVNIYNNLTLTADQNFQLISGAVLQIGNYANNVSTSQLNLNNYSLTLSGDRSQGSFIASTIEGSGNLIFDNTQYYIQGSSPNYTGSTILKPNSLVWMQNHSSALGSGSITVSHNATLVPFTPSTMANKISLSGDGTGINTTNGTDGALFAFQNLTLTGQISLTGNTTVGCQNSYSIKSSAKILTITTIAQPLETNGYSLATAPGCPANQLKFTAATSANNTSPAYYAPVAKPKQNNQMPTYELYVFVGLGLIILMVVIWLLVRRAHHKNSTTGPIINSSQTSTSVPTPSIINPTLNDNNVIAPPPQNNPSETNINSNGENKL